MKLIIACATDDSINFVDRHFGDADFYNIYELNSEGYTLIGVVNNTTEEEEIHADPKKAKGISQILKSKNVNVVMTKVFGPNIKRIRKTFVSVISRERTIIESMNLLVTKFELLEKTFNDGEERDLIKLSH
jgi:predicted Fe-Mo cluster-binding NifX family protein